MVRVCCLSIHITCGKQLLPHYSNVMRLFYDLFIFYQDD